MSEHAADSSTADALPPHVPDLELIRPIGEGGFGQVWLARNRTTGRLRAVKLISLRSKGRGDPAGREILSLTHLETQVGHEHPNLMNIDHVGKTANWLFYVMDLADDVSGGAASDPGYRPATLGRRLERGPLAPQECLRYAGQLLAGLACLHAAGVVHRDVKPANCLFVGGELKLADFGLLTEADRQASRLGTQGYMPPDGRMDARADVYAAGLVVYEMLTGLPAESFPRLGQQGRELAHDPILGWLNRLVLKACQPNPDERFRDAPEMLAELEALQTPTTGPPARLVRRVILSILLLVAMAAAVWGVWPSGPQRVHVNFITEPFDATVYLDGTLQTKRDGTPYLTPCTIPGLRARVHHVTFAHEGLPPLDLGDVDFAETREIAARWNPAL